MANNETFVERLSDIIIKYGAWTSQEAEAYKVAFQRSSKEAFDDFLLDEELIDEGVLLRALAEYYQVPPIDVLGHFFDHFLLQKFPKGFLLRNAVIPLDVDENILVMVASEPDNPELLSKIGEYVSYDIRFMVGLRRDICDAIKEFYDLSPTEVLQDEDIREKRRLRKEFVRQTLAKGRLEEGKEPPLPSDIEMETVEEEEEFGTYSSKEEEEK